MRVLPQKVGSKLPMLPRLEYKSSERIPSMEWIDNHDQRHAVADSSLYLRGLKIWSEVSGRCRFKQGKATCSSGEEERFWE